MAEFVYLFRATDDARRAAMGTPERAARAMQAWLTWIRELEAGGHLADPGQPLAPTGKVVRANEVIDGPHVEAKDLVLGFIVVRARDVDHAAALAAGCPMLAGGGSVEVRPIGARPA